MIGNSINDNLQMAVCETPNFDLLPHNKKEF
jgi:hypothetical protein